MISKKILGVLVLGSLMTLSGGVANAADNYVGKVIVDGTEQTDIDPNTDFTIGKDGSTVQVATAEGNSIFLGGTNKVTANVLGKTITTNHLTAWEDEILNIGNESTESVTITNEDGDAVYALHHSAVPGKGGTVTITGKTIDISAAGNVEPAAVLAQNGTETETMPPDSAHLTLQGDTIKLTSEDIGVAAFSNSRVDITGDTTITAPIAIDTRGYAVTNINADGKHSTVVNGDIKFETPLDSVSGKKIDATVNLNLTGTDSSWTGRAYTQTGENVDKLIDPSASAPGLNVTVKDDAAWNVTGDSLVNTLTVDNAQVNVQSAAKTVNADTVTLSNNAAVNLQGSGQTVNVNTLSGDEGVVNTNSLDNSMIVGDKQIKKLTVHGTSEISDAINKDNSNAQKLANVVRSREDATTSLADEVTTDPSTVAGSYDLVVDENGKVHIASYTQNPYNVGIAGLGTLDLMNWRQQNNDINKRLGELRDSKGAQGVWARMVRGEAEYSSHGLKSQYNFYQAGYDRKISADSNWTVGFAVNTTDGKGDFYGGNADMDNTGFALYGSYLGDHGSFVDIIGRYARLDNDYTAAGGAGSGDYKTDAYSFSAEYGKRFHQEGFWIEPQAELTYDTIRSVDYTTDKGVRVHHDSADSFVSRLGFAIGKDITAGHVYFRASWLHDFDGDTKTSMHYDGTSDTFKDDIGGSWCELGIGANLNIGRDTHLYMDVARSYGGDVKTPWQWGLGVRYSF